jgi:hypothetical protein
VSHEPIGYAYASRVFLRAYDRVAELRRLPIVSNHLARIHAIADDSDYVEVGFPAFSAIPLYIDEFGTRLRIVHLVRHPVRVATSMLSHDWYGCVRKDLTKQELHPTDPGVLQRGYAERWRVMNQFEKCLFYWSEVHAYGIEIHTTFPNTPFFRTRFEDLIKEPFNYLRRLVEFVGAPYHGAIAGRVKERVDSFRSGQRQAVDADGIQTHPLAVALAERFAYKIAISTDEICGNKKD